MRSCRFLIQLGSGQFNGILELRFKLTDHTRELMAAQDLPRFTGINLNQFPNELDNLLNGHLQSIDRLLDTHQTFNWENLMSPLESMEDEVERFWSPVSHCHGVVDSAPLRECYEACLPKLSAYQSAIGQNERLYAAIKSIDRQGLNSTQLKIIEDTVLDFELSGVMLDPDDKRRFEAISSRLSQLSTQFSNNVLDAVEAYALPITDETRLKGLPEHTVQRAREVAMERGLNGWVLTLESPCYLTVLSYADDRTLREELYYAYITRASELGPSAGKFDNTLIMDEILALRHEQAQVLGFANYAELSLATKMADTPDQVVKFLTDLATRVKKQALMEWDALKQFAKQHYKLDSLAPWDITYCAEKKKQDLYRISQETLRPYFPLAKVMQGLWETINRLYGVRFEVVKDVELWHADAECYQLIDEQGQPAGYLLMDLFARSGKRSGAWMDSCQSRMKRENGTIELPIATLTCNFAKAQGGLLTHEELETLFHEMGHCLHHLLTQVDYISASGIHGVEWDAVELPSQFFENWCWEMSAVHLLSAHVETGEPILPELFNQLLAAKNFNSAMVMLRQLEFGLFDFLIHRDYVPNQANFITRILAEVRQSISIIPIMDYNRVQHSFSHVFAGGYAAGYYSYLWAEVLSSDAFARFREEGVFNPKTGRDFLHCILQVGGSCPAMQAFKQFRGREANMDAFLLHQGINT